MAKFAGFTPQQQHTLLAKMGYQGPADQDEMNKFMAARPEAAIKLGRYAGLAQKRLEKTPAFAEGGSVTNEDITKITENFGATGSGVREAFKEKYGYWPKADSAEYKSYLRSEGYSNSANKNVQAKEDQKAFEQEFGSDKIVQDAIQDPGKFVQSPEVVEGEASRIKKDTGQLDPFEEIKASTAGDAQKATAPKVGDAETVQDPSKITTTTYDPTKVTDQVRSELEGLEAATADPSKQATVQGQLESLMADFEGGGTPPWAAGAMREAMAVMQARGMGASSMAGAAVVQAAMEAALPIAQADASTHASFEMQNLTNRQQTAIFKSQQMITSILSDQAADNAAKQFNATSENQTKQFMKSLETQVAQFNAAQINGMVQFQASMEADVSKFNAAEANEMERFNTVQLNTLKQFNKQLEDSRDKFNAEQAVVISQANAQWRQQMNLANTEAQNAANLYSAQAMNNLTAAAIDQIWQKERDLMAMAFEASESALDRENSIMLSHLDADTKAKLADEAGKGAVVATLVDAAGSFIGGLF